MLYEFPEFDNKSQIAAHAAAISNLRSVLKNEVDANSLITSSYNDKWNAINTIYDQYVVYAYNAQETYDNEATKSNLNYLNVYVEYQTYSYIALQVHTATESTWRPTALPDIITVPPGFGGAAYTFTLEQMVHWKLGMPIPFPHEQIRPDTWRLVRYLPKGSNIWHPAFDNLEGVDTVYGGRSCYLILVLFEMCFLCDCECVLFDD